jgi:hypothetical protein
VVQGVVGDQRRWALFVVRSVPATAGQTGDASDGQPADDRGSGDDDRKRYCEHGEREEGCDREPDQQRVGQGASGDPDDGLGDDGDHRGTEAGEQGGDNGGVSEADVERGQREQRHQPGKHEQHTCGETAAAPVEQPAHVDGG